MESLLFALLLLVSCRYSESVPVNGVVRLYQNGASNSSLTSGIVQIYSQGAWGNLCNDFNFNITEADVLCHQLGYTNALSFTSAANSMYGIDNSPTLLNEVDCSSSDYLNILQCQYSYNIASVCNDQTDVAIYCNETKLWEDPYPGMIRLTGGEYTNEGRVEIYCNDLWGTICNDAGVWGIDGRIICRQLGYDDVLDYNLLSILSDIPLPAWISYSYCPDANVSCFSGNCARCPISATQRCSYRTSLTLTCYSLNDDTSDTQIDTCQNIDVGPDQNQEANHLGLIVGATVGGILFAIIILAVIVSLIDCLRKAFSPSVSYEVETHELN